MRKGSRQAAPPFDWEKPETWSEALRGVDAAYISFYPDLALASAPATIEALVTSARNAGVKRLVLLSARGEANALRCENIVRACGVGYTLLRASWFAQNFDEGELLEPVRSGLVALPAGQMREPFIDIDDIADVAVEALTNQRHAGHLYELTGPRLLTFAEAAAELSKAAGREIRYAPISPEEFRATLKEQSGPELANLLTELCKEVFDGRNESLGDGVQKALGRQPRDFANFCRAAAASGVWNV